MSLAIAHTHRVLHTSHMDIKPANFLLDDNDNLILIDWEQVSAPPSTLAPEADGTWDVREQHGKLVYTKYMGPPRRNMPDGYGDQPFHVWNVFPEWNVSCPRASEQAEVFALGRTMWLLLSQAEDVFEDVEHPNDVQVSWGQAKKELPRLWIEIVQICMDEDPRQRPSLAGLVKFWEMAEFWDTEEVARGKPVIVG
jgi:serine/threonine protein kinase